MRNSSKPIRNGPLLQTFDQKRFLHQENFFEPIDLLKVPYTQGFLIQNGVILIQIVSFLLKKFQKVSGSIKTSSPYGKHFCKQYTSICKGICMRNGLFWTRKGHICWKKCFSCSKKHFYCGENSFLRFMHFHKNKSCCSSLSPNDAHWQRKFLL